MHRSLILGALAALSPLAPALAQVEGGTSQPVETVVVTAQRLANARNGIQTQTATQEFTDQLRARIAFFKDNWFADAKAKGIDAQAAYDYFAKTSQEVAAQMAK